MSKQKLPPGPQGKFIRGVFPRFLENPLDLLTESAAQHGDIASLRFVDRRIYLLSHPDYIKHVLVNNARNYVKGRALGITKPIVGEGLLTSEHDFHHQQRRLIQPAFHRRRIGTFAQSMTCWADRHSAGWDEGQLVDLHEELMQMTMKIVAQTLFGVDITSEDRTLATALNGLMTAFDFSEVTPLGRLLSRLPLPRTRRRQALLKTLDEAIYRFIERGRRRDQGGDDLLSMLLEAQDSQENDSRMSDKQVRDEVMTLFIAGHETTANALAWSFYLLSRHPAVEARLQAELERVLGGRPPDLDDVAELKFTRMIFAEAMRLYPPAWAMGRTALADDEIGGYPLPAGTPVLISQWVMHRHPTYWSEPERFNPDRFDPDHPATRQRPRYVYFPFGGGPRLCIGEPFAWLEGVLLIATLAQRFRFSLTPQARIEPEPGLTLRLRYGLPMVVHNRHAC